MNSPCSPCSAWPASLTSDPGCQGGAAISMAISKVTLRRGRSGASDPLMRSVAFVSSASPSNDAVHFRKGSTQRKCNGPDPNIVGCPSGPMGEWVAKCSRTRSTRPLAKAISIQTWWLSHSSVTASTPIRMAKVAFASSIHTFTASRMPSPCGRSAKTNSRSRLMPPLRSMAMDDSPGSKCARKITAIQFSSRALTVPP